MAEIDVCSHGRPDHQELVRRLRGALGMYPGAMPVSPEQAFEEALEEIRRWRAFVQKWEAKGACIDGTTDG